MNKKGISLIVLVITIIVIVILAGAIYLSLLQSNPILTANEATFKSDIMSIQEELGLYLATNIQNNGSYIYPTKSDIKLADKYDSSVLNIVNDKIIYKTSDKNEKMWAESLGIIVDYTDGLVANYKMNGNALDSSGNNNGIVNGATLTSDRFGRTNSAYSFNGTSNYINCGTNPILKPSNITLSAWVKANSLPQWSGIISNMTSWGTGFSLQIGDTQKIASMISGQYLTTSWKPSTNVWYNIVSTHNSSNNENKLYVNGKLENTSFGTVNYEDNAKTYIGVFYTSPGLFFKGTIDDVRIYNRVLSDSDVKSLYNVYWAD
jgi:Tfp pilus assembly protein PilE